MDLGIPLKDYMAQQNLNQSEAAERLRVTQGTISNMLREKHGFWMIKVAGNEIKRFRVREA